VTAPPLEVRGADAPLAALLAAPELHAILGWNASAPEPPTLLLAAPFDPASSFHSVILAWAQQPAATQLAGADTWRRLGRRIRPGQHGLVVLTAGAPSEALVAAAGTLPGAIPTVVFDLAQTEPTRNAGASAAGSLTGLLEQPGTLALAGRRQVTYRSPTPGRATRELAHNLATLDLAAARAAADAHGPAATAVAVVASDPNGLRADVRVLPAAAVARVGEPRRLRPVTGARRRDQWPHQPRP
jgi:hypothetical protein